MGKSINMNIREKVFRLLSYVRIFFVFAIWSHDIIIMCICELVMELEVVLTHVDVGRKTNNS